MTAEEWEVTKQILDAAAGLPEAEREAWALRATEKWPSVRGAVLELLPHYRHDPSDACPCAPHVVAPGQLVAGRFHVVRLIAEGGMGEVYEAHDKWLRLRLALKTLRHGQAADGDTLERFKRELLIARGVAHENLCRVYDFVEHRAPGPDGQEVLTPCFTMELLEGETLSDLLSRERPLPLDAVLNIVRQVVSALKLLHERGIIHRDLKPSNIMIVPRTGGPVRAVVTDFGLAKPDAPHELFESAPDFEGAGAPYFMAPELIRKQRPGVASDIYALGLLIDEMVTTSRAYSSRSMTALFFDKLHETPVPPSARSPELPPHWERTILRCIEQEPSARFASAAEVAAALENPGLTALAAPAVGAVAAGRAEPGRSRLRFPGWGWIAAMIALPTVFVMAAWAALARQPVSTSIQISEIENLTARSDYDALSDRVRRWLASPNVTSPPAWPAANSTAFDLYMRGQNLLEEVSPPAAAAAIEYFRRAIEEDPSFALAYAALSEATAQLMNYRYRAQSELSRQARQYAQKAVELDPSLPEAHAVLASVKQMDWDWKGAEASYREALRLKPGFRRARRSYAGTARTVWEVGRGLV